MTDERFNDLLNGPLSHPMMPFTISRLALALKAVVDATGPAGELALEEHCAGRIAQDHDIDLDQFDLELDRGGAA